MHWNFRPAKAEDLPACQRMLSDWARFTFDDEVWAALPHIWHELLTRKALTITIFEDLDLPLGRRLGGFNVGVFVADALTAEILAIPKPYLANRLYRSCLGKDPWPLGFPQIRQANSTTGVNLVLDYAFFTHDWRRLELFPLFAVVQDAFHFDFYGHHFRCILAEVFGEEARDYFLRWGFKTKGTPPGVGDGSCPFLMGLGKEEALSCAGRLWPFISPPRRLSFTFAPPNRTCCAWLCATSAIRRQPKNSAFPSTPSKSADKTFSSGWRTSTLRGSRVRPATWPGAEQRNAAIC
ncbi:MAG: hypothetical protein N3A55_11090 [Methylohalobius sp.]|nr:hypothetical protein [Methylohalobius sp.]